MTEPGVTGGAHISIAVPFALFVTVGFGLGYAKARYDSQEVIDRLDKIDKDLADLTRHVKYGDAIDGQVLEERTVDPAYGHCDTCGAPCDRKGCIEDRKHVASKP